MCFLAMGLQFSLERRFVDLLGEVGCGRNEESGQGGSSAKP